MEQNDNNNVNAPPQAQVADAEPQSQEMQERPRQVIVAIWLLCISFSLGYLNLDLIYPLITGTAHPSASAIAVGLIFDLTLSIWTSRKLFLGRNWMRMVFLILFVIGVAFTPFRMTKLFHGSTELMTVYSVQSIIQAIALWLLLTKPGNDWFRRKTA